MLYVRSIVIMLVSLYTTRVVFGALGVADYGIYNVVGGMVTMFAMISGTLASATQRFLTYSLGEDDAEKPRRVFSTSLTLHVILGVALVLLLEVAGVWLLESKLNIPPERMGAAHVVLQCSIFTLFFNVISVPYNALIIAHERMSAFAYISIVEAGLKLGVALLLLCGQYDKLTLYAVLQLAVSVIIRLIYSLYSRSHFSEARHTSYQIDKPLFRQMFAFSAWNFVGNGTLTLRNQGVDLVLNLFHGVVINAASGISNQIQTAVRAFSGNFITALVPQLTVAVAKKDKDRIVTLVNQGTRFSFFLMTLFVGPILISCQEILAFWLGDVPVYTVVLVRCTMLYLLLDVQSRLLVQSVLSSGNIRNCELAVGGVKLLAVPAVYAILLLGGSPLTGVYVNLLLELPCLVLRLYFSHRLVGLPIKPFLRVAVYSWAVFLLSMVPPCLVYRYVMTNLWFVSSFCLMFVVGLGYILLLKDDERQKIRHKINF